MLVGAGILWIGWNGFNGGDPYSASPDAGAAVLNTNLCTAFSSVVWVLMDLMYYRRPSVIGAIQGMITGLVSKMLAHGFCLINMPVGRYYTCRWCCRWLGSHHPRTRLRNYPMGLPQSRKTSPQDLPARRRHSR
jgi:hypothetical protein